MTIKKETPLWQLNVDEFISLLKENGVGALTQTIVEQEQPKEQYVYGLNGLAKFLGCSRVTAQKIKNSGELKGCYMQVNRKLVFDVELVKNALKGR